MHSDEAARTALNTYLAAAPDACGTKPFWLVIAERIV
jgi:hypothetical protein